MSSQTRLIESLRSSLVHSDQVLWKNATFLNNHKWITTEICMTLEDMKYSAQVLWCFIWSFTAFVWQKLRNDSSKVWKNIWKTSVQTWWCVNFWLNYFFKASPSSQTSNTTFFFFTRKTAVKWKIACVCPSTMALSRSLTLICLVVICIEISEQKTTRRIHPQQLERYYGYVWL